MGTRSGKQIIPAIMPEGMEEIEELVGSVVGRVSTVQLDLMDGEFVDPTTWPFQANGMSELNTLAEEQDGFPYWKEIDYEIDLMIKNSYQHFDTFFSAGISQMIFHPTDIAEYVSFAQSIETMKRQYISIGVALSTTDSVDAWSDAIAESDFVQCMGIEHIGYQGQPFDDRVISQIKELRSRYPEKPISVDGSVNRETIGTLAAAGADRFVSGSAIWKGDPAENIKELKSLIQ